MKLTHKSSQLVAGYFTAQEIADKLGTSLANVRDLKKRHGWEGVRVNTTLYPADKISDYLAARERTELLRKLGAKLSGDTLIWHDDNDWACPKCNRVAVEYRGRLLCPDGHETIAWDDDTLNENSAENAD